MSRVGSFTLRAKRNQVIALIVIHVGSISNQRKPVTRGKWERVMVVVPAFAERQERDPPIIGRTVAGRKGLIADGM